ncbi:hypothetical protein [Microbulbifer sp. VAAF005]|uniref:hypothetical protein n=1 Tax=Microbulbifer sp. VAAF005 TaxID=3034230 RepID=UPI0024AE4862|nr:hypothetical protein [Microbulbifer sp. VAAF005]WHI45257.1 hypothetical protein P0078_16165 [Microbulbifer sp. VAAF005]
MVEKEIISFFGKPDRIDESEYVEGNGDWHRELWYSLRNLTFTFNNDDDFRLGTITVMGAGYSLFKKQLFGLGVEEVSRLIAKDTGEIAKLEDWSSEELPNHKCLIHDGLGIMFWFDYNYLTQMQCSYLFKADNKTIIWPVNS